MCIYPEQRQRHEDNNLILMARSLDEVQQMKEGLSETFKRDILFQQLPQVLLLTQ